MKQLEESKCRAEEETNRKRKKKETKRRNMKKVSKRGNRREVLEGPGLAKFQMQVACNIIHVAHDDDRCW